MHNDAITQFNEALRLNPAFADAFVARGYCHGDLGNFAQAAADMSQALILEKDLKEFGLDDTYVIRADYYNALGDYPSAINDAKMALKLHPGYDLAIQALTVAQSKNNQFVSTPAPLIKPNYKALRQKAINFTNPRISLIKPITHKNQGMQTMKDIQIRQEEGKKLWDKAKADRKAIEESQKNAHERNER